MNTRRFVSLIIFLATLFALPLLPVSIAFATGEAVSDRVSDLGAVIGRTAALMLVHGLHGRDQ
jgi:hypothetical protein